jgi:hypothetical protein
MAKPTEADGSLKRLGGGRWQTRDERFSIEPQSGTWVVVDAEQTDDLGLPLVRGPFGSLGAAKEAIASAREAAPAVSPLAAKVATLRARPAAPPDPDDADRSGLGRTTSSKPNAAQAEPAGPPTVKPAKPVKPAEPVKPEAPSEPQWLLDLAPAQRPHARQLIARLTHAAARDPEGIAHRDVVGRVPAAAAFAISRAIDALGPDASPADIARLLADGRDAELDVRWRLVDDDGRPIALDLGRTARPLRA